MLSYSIITILMYHYYSTLSLQFYWSFYNQWCTLQLINRTTSLLYMWKLSSYKNLIWSQILILWELWKACKCMEFSIHFRCSIWPHFKCSFSENLINDVRLKAANSNRCFNWPLKLWRVVAWPVNKRRWKRGIPGQCFPTFPLLNIVHISSSKYNFIS